MSPAVRKERAGEIPMERPTRFDFVVNLKTARAGGAVDAFGTTARAALPAGLVEHALSAPQLGRWPEPILNAMGKFSLSPDL